MKKITFRKIGAENFCIFDTIDFKIDPGLTLITGPNGSGKTSLVEIIPYTLFGITSKGIKADSVVNNRVGKNCMTFVEFDDQSSYYRIERYRKHYKYSDSVKIFKDGNDISPNKIKLANSIIENIIISPKLIMNVVFFAQKVKSFFTNCPDSEQKSIFREILGIEEFLKYQKSANNLYSITENELNRLKTEYEINVQLKNENEENIKKYELLLKNYEEDRKLRILKITEEIQNIENVLKSKDESSIKAKLDKLIDKSSSIKSNIYTLKSKIENLNKEFEENKNKIVVNGELKISLLQKNLLEESQKIKDKINEIINEHSIKVNELTLKMRNELEVIESKLNNLISESNILNYKHKKIIEEINVSKELLKDGICPYCKQKINKEIIGDNISKYSEELKHIENQILNTNSEIDILKSKKDKIKEKIKILDNEFKTKSKIQPIIESLKNDIHKLNEKINSDIEIVKVEINGELKQIESKYESTKNKIIEDINILELDLSEINNKIYEARNELENINELKKQIDIKKSNIKNIENETPPQIELIKSAKLKLLEINENIKNIENKMKPLNNKLNIIEFWKKGFSSTGIPSMLIDDSIPFMNKVANEYLLKVSDGRYSIAFSALSEISTGELRDRISINLLDRLNMANEKEQLSGGQERLIDICIMLTLIDLMYRIRNIDINILILDEVFDSLDEENILNVSNLLKDISKRKSVIVISHKHINDIDFDRHLSF